MDKSLIKYFWNCGDNDIIEFALLKARLNKKEKDVLELLLDECMTQEEAAEKMGYSPRRIQEYWYSATYKLLSISWVKAYAQYLKNVSFAPIK